MRPGPTSGSKRSCLYTGTFQNQTPPHWVPLKGFPVSVNMCVPLNTFTLSLQNLNLSEVITTLMHFKCPLRSLTLTLKRHSIILFTAYSCHLFWFSHLMTKYKPQVEKKNNTFLWAVCRSPAQRKVLRKQNRIKVCMSFGLSSCLHA